MNTDKNNREVIQIITIMSTLTSVTAWSGDDRSVTECPQHGNRTPLHP